MTRNILKFEYMMINSLLFLAIFPQELKPIGYVLISIPLMYFYRKCYDELRV